jgi:hypothetical protein
MVLATPQTGPDHHRSGSKDRMDPRESAVDPIRDALNEVRTPPTSLLRGLRIHTHPEDHMGRKAIDTSVVGVATTSPTATWYGRRGTRCPGARRPAAFCPDDRVA